MTSYAFHFDASACSGCKACQVACKDKHDLPLGVRWRRVYEVVGGGWTRRDGAWLNDVFAYNVSVACNQCEDPICMEVCPAGAITRRPDGIVLLDSDRCLGCRYCEWACPYGAPQYDRARGHMTKCTSCVDEVDQGGQPACVSACGLRVLDFGDQEEMERRHGGTRAMHPLPDPSLTRPGLTLTPHPRAARAAAEGARVANREETGGTEPRERSLVAFTLLAQTAVGMVWALAVLGWVAGREGGASGVAGSAAQLLRRGQLPALVVAGALTVTAASVSLLHLGSPRNAWRSLSNLGRSWLGREILLLGIFAAAWAALVAAAGAGGPTGVLTAVAAAAGLGLVHVMSRVYRLRTVPSWDRALTAVRFFAAAVVLGALATAFVVTVASLPGGSGDAGGSGRAVILAAALLAAAVGAVLDRSAFYRSYARSGL